MTVEINVQSDGERWALSSSLAANPTYFLSGGQAERAARLLAQRVAVSGLPARVEIVLADGSVLGRISFPAGGR